MPKRTLIVSASAHEDQIILWTFTLRASQKLEIADRVAASIAGELDHLSEFPLSGHVREELAPSHVRFRQVYSYLIAYTFDLDNVYILAIIHASRDAKPILEDRW